MSCPLFKLVVTVSQVFKFSPGDGRGQLELAERRRRGGGGAEASQSVQAGPRAGPRAAASESVRVDAGTQVEPLMRLTEPQ